MEWLTILFVLLVLVLASGCRPAPACQPEALGAATLSATTLAEGTPAPGRASTGTAELLLPEPSEKGKYSLEETLLRRRSVREFADTPLSLEELGQLLWAAQGVTDSGGHRTAPSAGARYPLVVYAVTAQRVYEYHPDRHRMSWHIEGDARLELYEAAIEQDMLLQAPATIVIAAVYAHTEGRYGPERTPRYVHMEAGHAAQNILLQAVALDLGAVPVGAFYDAEVQSALNLPADQKPLYLIPVGRPR